MATTTKKTKKQIREEREAKRLYDRTKLQERRQKLKEAGYVRREVWLKRSAKAERNGFTSVIGLWIQPETLAKIQEICPGEALGVIQAETESHGSPDFKLANFPEPQQQNNENQTNNDQTM